MSAETALGRLADDPELELEIRDGTEHWRGGEITLTVTGAGRAEVLHRRAGEEHTYTAALDRGRIAELAGAVAGLGLDQAQSRRAALEPDELTTRFVLRRGGQVLYEAEIPGGERHDDERLDAVMGRYEQLVAEATEGALPFGAAAAPT